MKTNHNYLDIDELLERAQALSRRARVFKKPPRTLGEKIICLLKACGYAGEALTKQATWITSEVEFLDKQAKEMQSDALLHDRLKSLMIDQTDHLIRTIAPEDNSRDAWNAFEDHPEERLRSVNQAISDIGETLHHFAAENTTLSHKMLAGVCHILGMLAGLILLPIAPIYKGIHTFNTDRQNGSTVSHALRDGLNTIIHVTPAWTFHAASLWGNSLGPVVHYDTQKNSIQKAAMLAPHARFRFEAPDAHREPDRHRDIEIISTGPHKTVL